MKIKINRIQCRLCLDIISSLHIHDFKYCKCGKVAVDGGNEYLKRLGNAEDFDDISIIENK